MNPLTNIKNLNAMNERELSLGVAGTSRSWHSDYRDSAWVFVGGLPFELTEGDVLAVLSQYGEIVHINLVRDHQSGKSRGFGFVCYEDQRSTVLAVDNLNGIRLCKRTIRVDHVQTYKLPKDLEKMDADRKKLFLEGCAPKPIGGPEEGEDDEEEVSGGEESADSEDEKRKKKKRKKEKKEKKKKKKREDQDRGDGDGRDRRRERSRSRDRGEDRDVDRRRRDRHDDDGRRGDARRRRSRSRSRSRERRRDRR